MLAHRVKVPLRNALKHYMIPRAVIGFRYNRSKLDCRISTNYLAPRTVSAERVFPPSSELWQIDFAPAA